MTKVFGVPLSEVCESENLPIPRVTEEIFKYLEEKAIKKEGIFRIPGNSLYVDQLKAYYNGESEELTLDTCTDIHAVAGLLKLYLRELPDPLLTHRFYNTFIAVQKNTNFDYRMTNIRKLVNALPKSHKNLLTRLLAFLIKVSEYSEVNKMSEPNLAIVFGPNLLRPHNESTLRMIEDARHVNSVTLALLEEFDYLVTCSATVPHKRPEPVIVNPPNLAIEYSTPSPANLTSKRRAFKFNVTELPPLDGESASPSKQSEKDDLTTSTQNHETLQQERKELSVSTNGTDSFDLDNPYEYITKQLENLSICTKRKPDLSNMTIEQKMNAKTVVKAQLRAFDSTYESVHGSLPGKKDKEPLRPIYQLYRTLSQSIDKEKQTEKTTNTEKEGSVELTGSCEGNTGDSILATAVKNEVSKKPPLEDNPEYIELKKEKRRLQCLLHKYQEDFIVKYGRKVQYLQDREPVQEEYEAYKKLKSKISALEDSYKKMDK